MIIVALLIVWNSFLLWVTMGAIGGWLLPYFGVTMTFMEIGILCFLFTALFAILSASSIGDTFLKFPLSLRSPIGREQKRLEPLLKKLQGIMQEKLDRAIPCQIFITEVAHPYIQTLGRKTIVLPRLLLERLDDDALMAGIAATQGRFYHRNSLYYSMALGASFLGNGIQRILRWLATTITRIGYRHVWLLPVGFLGSLLSLLLKGLQTITSFCLMGYIRRRIYASDQLTKTLDLREHFVSYLETLAQGEDRQDGFLVKYQEQFPSAMQRIHQLES